MRDGKTSTADLLDEAIDAAIGNGHILKNSEPRAASATYDRNAGRIVVVLTNGCTFSFPPHLAQGLGSATDDQLSEISILGAGYGLHWHALDVDFSVPGLLSGIFGTAAYMAQRAGRGMSPAKAAAARANGAKGGRPRKYEA